MAAFETLRDKIEEKLNNIDTIQYVYDYPAADLKGYPAAVVRAVSNEADYETTTENLRTYVFEVYVYQESEYSDRRQSRRILEGVVDDVLNEFDKDQYLNGISLASSETMIGVRPALSSIYDEEKWVVAEVGLAIRVSIDWNAM